MKVKIFKRWCVLCIIIALFVLGISSIVQANERSTVGFEFGVNYIKPGESRFDGMGSYFSLVLPIDKGITASIYHESDRYSGEDTDLLGAKVNTTLDIDINELRIQKEIISIVEKFMVEAFLGVGYASVTNGFNANAPVADIGVKLTPFKTEGEVSNVKLSFDLLYRFLKINSTQAFAGTGDPNVDDLGGFVTGLNVAVLF